MRCPRQSRWSSHWPTGIVEFGSSATRTPPSFSTGTRIKDDVPASGRLFDANHNMLRRELSVAAGNLRLSRATDPVRLGRVSISFPARLSPRLTAGAFPMNALPPNAGSGNVRWPARSALKARTGDYRCLKSIKLLAVLRHSRRHDCGLRQRRAG
jgi:hypothetical protein